ncbi:hypothetical protein WME76_47175 (plasmid) [Sorangium sp. So ce119]|uniref:hypothetical protein n=1 Tax=Sorangium sp. So ce119 TaxID=3133279 RepID=UPI003F62924A
MSLPATTRALDGRHSAAAIVSAAALAVLLAACGPDVAGEEPGSCGGATCGPDQYCVYPPGDRGEGGVVPGNYKPKWVKNGTLMSGTADYGALFIRFNVNGDPKRATAYFKDVDGRLADEFTIQVQ